MGDLFIKDWAGLLNVFVCTVVAYLAVFSFIRISGKRTMSKLSAFDFVVAVTLGSTLSSMILAKVPVIEGLLGVAIIIGLQFSLAKLAQNSSAMETIIQSRPALLFYNGEFMEKTLSDESITQEEIHAAVRKFRLERMDEVRAVVMESNGDLTVVKMEEGAGPSSLDDLDQS
jgi:uncharacterized membrane protein YcaP (DUF421 family)